MRVVQFVTLFLALSVVCGCSHRRSQRVPVAATFCDCSTCRCEQQRLISEGAVPADHFQSYGHSELGEPVATIAPAQASPVVNDFAPEYSNAAGSGSKTSSPYSSGNPIEMDGEAPQMFSPPVVDDIITDKNQFLPSTSPPDLNLELPKSNQITPESGDFGPIDQIPSETLPNGAFKPFNRDVFKVKSQIESVPLQQQPSILIEKVSETHQPDLSSLVPQVREPETNDFQIPDSLALDHLSLNQDQVEVTEPIEPVAEPVQPYRNQFKPTAEVSLPAPDNSIPLARTFTPVPQPIRQTETVVQGELYEDPIVLYARQRRALLTASAVQTPGSVQPASVQKPAEHQSIVQNSEFDPVYGLPLSNDVQFDSLPAVQQPQPQAASSSQSQHLHVHIHHDYSSNATGQVQHSQQAGPQARNVQVVYRDEDGRVMMAPPTPTGGLGSAEPRGDQRTYYVPPEQILRLQATSPINRPRSNPSVATIQMRDTVIHGGTHLLATPDNRAQPVLTEHGLPGIDYKQLRKAFNTSPTDNPLR